MPLRRRVPSWGKRRRPWQTSNWMEGQPATSNWAPCVPSGIGDGIRQLRLGSRRLRWKHRQRELWQWWTPPCHHSEWKFAPSARVRLEVQGLVNSAWRRHIKLPLRTVKPNTVPPLRTVQDLIVRNVDSVCAHFRGPSVVLLSMSSDGRTHNCNALMSRHDDNPFGPQHVTGPERM